MDVLETQLVKDAEESAVHFGGALGARRAGEGGLLMGYKVSGCNK